MEMPNKIDQLVALESFVRITTELLPDEAVKFDLQIPNTPIIKNGLAYVEFTLTKERVEWLYKTLKKYYKVDKAEKEDKQLELPLK